MRAIGQRKTGNRAGVGRQDLQAGRPALPTVEGERLDAHVLKPIIAQAGGQELGRARLPGRAGEAATVVLTEADEVLPGRPRGPEVTAQSAVCRRKGLIQHGLRPPWKRTAHS